MNTATVAEADESSVTITRPETGAKLDVAAFSLRSRGTGLHPRNWQGLAGLGIVALTAAAFLRWFS